MSNTEEQGPNAPTQIQLTIPCQLPDGSTRLATVSISADKHAHGGEAVAVSWALEVTTPIPAPPDGQHLPLLDPQLIGEGQAQIPADPQWLRRQLLRFLLEELNANPDLVDDIPPALWASVESGLLRPYSEKGSSVPNAFAGGYGQVPSNPGVFSVVSAINKGGPQARRLMEGWIEGETGRPTYTREDRRGGRIIVYPNPNASAAETPLPTTDTLWSLVESLNPFTADVALAVLAQLCEPSVGERPHYPLLEPVRITADAILSYKGIQRWGKERRQLQERVQTEMERLGNLAFDVEAYPAYHEQQGKRTRASWRGDRLFDIVRVEVLQERLFDEEVEIAVSWSVRAGQWAYWWLNPQSRVYLARLARTILNLDHRENRGPDIVAKKIGQHILLRAATDSTTLTLIIGQLLADIGELPIAEARSKHWAGRARDRFEEALARLKDEGVFATVVWPQGYGAGEDDRIKGWVERWLVAPVQITLPAIEQRTPLLLAPPQLPPGLAQAALGVPKAEAPIGERLRVERLRRRWRQDALAQHLAISLSYLSQVENGKRQPSAPLLAKIVAWLEASALEDDRQTGC